MVDLELAKRMILAPLTTDTTAQDIEQFAKDLTGIEIYSVIVDEYYISLAKELMPGRKVGTIASYPFGGFTTEMNVKLIEQAVALGCSEVDICPKFNYLKSGKYELAKPDLRRIVEAAQGKLAIVAVPQVGQMTLNELEKNCKLFLECGIRIIKTNSGFGQGESQFEHIQFVRRIFGKDIEIEVSGGVRTREDARRYLELGADRIHSSTWKSVIGWEGEAAK
ncbi:MAG: HisA/HisF-related TIM barrel protein [Candidatus Pelethousia sp.]|nr:HisA/HisF-related TIM barrel protein [Candidatus Pelethousia sp.]